MVEVTSQNFAKLLPGIQRIIKESCFVCELLYDRTVYCKLQMTVHLLELHLLTGVIFLAIDTEFTGLAIDHVHSFR